MRTQGENDNMSVEFGHADPNARFHTARGAEADPPGVSTSFIGLVGVLVLVVVVLGLETLFYYTSNRENQTKLYEARYADRVHLQQTQREQLAKYGMDPQTGKVQIPIERAMELVVPEGRPTRGS
jgi:hypothetical protein